MGAPFKQDIDGHVPRSAGLRYEAVLRLSEGSSACREPEELTKVLSRDLAEFLDFFQFYIIVYKQNSTDVEWAVLGPEKSQVVRCAGSRAASLRVYATQEPRFIVE